MIFTAAYLALTVARSGGPPARPAPKPPVAMPIAPDNRLCQLNVNEYDVAKILKLLSEQTKVNLILLSHADAKLTINLTGIPLSEMIRHICAMTGLSALKVDSIYAIGPEAQLKSAYPKEWEAVHPEPAPAVPPKKQEEMATEVLHLNYIDGKQANDTIAKMFPDSGIVISPGPAPTSPNVVAKETSNTTGTAAGVITPEPVSDAIRSLVIRGPKAAIEAATMLLRSLDVPRPQVTIQVTIDDISTDAAKELGISWQLPTEIINESTPNGFNFGTFSRTALSFNAVLHALETKNQGKLLASPNVTVLDGERAFVLIGDRISFPVLVGYTQGNSPIFSREEERVGIYLQVAPSISSDGTITLSLYPQVSTVSGFLNVNGASYPQIATREAQTTLRVKSGDTIVMGGLLKNDDLTELEKVPFLSQIPIFGELFTRRKKTLSQSQVIITITPTINKPLNP